MTTTAIRYRVPTDFAETSFKKDCTLPLSKHVLSVVVVALFLPSVVSAVQLPTSGDRDIDRVRAEVCVTPTTAENYQRRALLLFTWLGSLQQQSADTHPFFDVDKKYYELERKTIHGRGAAKQEAVQSICKTVDEGFEVLESIFRKLREKGPIYEPFIGSLAGAPKDGDMEADWPMFQGNKHNNGYTEAPGPKTGELAWKVPVGLGWYARPVIEGDRVYVASPGMHTTSFCLDLATGEEIWKSTQDHPLLGIYKYPAMMSTPVILKDRMVLREVNSHGGNEGQAKNLVYIDKQTGKTLSRKYAGHIDYRTQVAPVQSNGKFMVYPFGVHDIYGSPAICQNLNRLICADVDNERRLWDFNAGDIDALAEPVMTESRVMQGTMEGYLYSFNLEGPHDARIAWKFRADGAVNTAVALAGETVYFGSNGGVLYALNEADGSLSWQTSLDAVEKRARKQFTVPLVIDGKLYVGSANKCFYCLDANSGKVLWETELTDWIRSKPVMTSEGLVVASVDGTVTCLSTSGAVQWQKKISTHPIYADLASAGDSVLVNDSDLWLRCINAQGDLLWKKSLLKAYENERCERIFTDVLSGGTYYQSKPTAANGKVYFGNPAGFLFSIDAETGKEVWKFEMGGAISVAPAIAEGKVFAGQQGGERFFYCVDAETGELVWKQTVPGGWVWGSAAVDDGLVYIPTVDGHAVCLDAETGHMIWMYPTAKSVPAEPAIDGDLVYFGSWSHSLYAFNKKTGEIVWKENGIGLDSGTLIANDGKIYLPHHANVFMYFDAKNGEILSRGNMNPEEKGQFTNFNATPAFHNDRAYYTARVGTGLHGVPTASRVYCVDSATAKIHWTFPDGGGLSAPAIASDRVYIGSGNTPLFYCLDAASGKPLWIYKLGQRVEEATLCIYRDKVYVLAGDGYVHAIK
ncbi:outer membrane protein assembly factor BamB family protein [Novipirellula artificiosorum]|uniref:Outer membrane protein assembly factor BamB n=1 Tax=Novipirellula artificiosorum TaxID=2528016 RepID=A0A5C6DN74_9BACT|nr:PQQ-binding-like beta-propeller repeat protein [Novipirellula artificiosorum]TWU38290.1 Outer membrane protein assembly factor BamB precursor [Novipirellula artificiosorum]